MDQEFELVKGDTVIVFRLLEMDCPGDHWVITADYVREYPASRPTQRAADLAVCTCPKVGSEIYHVVGCPATFPHSPNR